MLKPKYRIRPGTAKDLKLIHTLICELARFEKLFHEVRCTPHSLSKVLFKPKSVAHVLIVEIKEGKKSIPVGFALYFYNFSTFLGKPGIYLEDLFVLPQYRSLGLGLSLLKHLAYLAIKNKCGRLEWAVLDWNKRAIKFYRKQGAKPLSEWTVNRVTGPALKKLAKGSRI